MKISIEGFKPGDYIIVTVPSGYDGQIRCPGFKEAGLLGGAIVEEDVMFEAYTDEMLARIGLERTKTGSQPAKGSKE